MRGEEIMVTSDLIPGLAYFDTGVVTKETTTQIHVRFPGRLRAVKIDKNSGKYEPLGRRGMEPEEQ